MLSVVLLILKGLGIAFLVILALLLLLLSLLLFVPFRYRGETSYHHALHVAFDISWLLHAFCFRVRYADSLHMELCLLRSSIWNNQKKSSSPPEHTAGEAASLSEKTREGEKRMSQTADWNSEQPMQSKPISTEPNQTEVRHTEGGQAEPNQTEIRHTEDNQAESNQTEVHRKTKQEQKKDWRTWAWQRLEQAETIRDRIGEELSFFRHERTKRAFRRLRQALSRILKELLPRSMDGCLRFGFDDPFTTGQICAAAALLLPLYRDRLTIQPIFDRTVLDGELSLKGRIRLIVLLIAGLRVWRDRDCRYAYENYQKRKRQRANCRKTKYETEEEHG